MDERIREVFLRYADKELEQIIISKSKDASLQKVKIRPVQIKDELKFQTEEFRGAQVFHKNMTVEECLASSKFSVNRTPLLISCLLGTRLSIRIVLKIGIKVKLLKRTVLLKLCLS